MAKAFGIVNFAGNHIRVEGMQEYRPVGAFSFLGRYRVIDFPISNMSNSGIDHIQVYIRRNPQSLTAHLGTGRHYNIFGQFLFDIFQVFNIRSNVIVIQTHVHSETGIENLKITAL